MVRIRVRIRGGGLSKVVPKASATGGEGGQGASRNRPSKVGVRDSVISFKRRAVGVFGGGWSWSES
jgi:hypothetical protein